MILVTIDPQDGERELVEDALGPVRWLVDGPGLDGVEGVLSLWPRREFTQGGLTWDDLPDAAWLKVITAGVNHVGWQDIPEHVRVMATPAATGPFIAEYVLGAVIAWARGFMRDTRAISAGRFPLGRGVRSVAELNVGVIGHGGLGQSIAAVLAGHGAVVRAVSRSGRPGDVPVESVATMDHLPELLAWADVLVLAVPLQNDTYGLIDAAALETFGAGLLVNVARGPIVDEDALYEWLAADPVGRAAQLDVWWQYPKDGGHPYHRPFHELGNVVMTPHNSPNVTGHRLRMLARAVEDLRAWQQTGEMRHIEDRGAYRLPSPGDTR